VVGGSRAAGASVSLENLVDKKKRGWSSKKKRKKERERCKRAPRAKTQQTKGPKKKLDRRRERARTQRKAENDILFHATLHNRPPDQGSPRVAGGAWATHGSILFLNSRQSSTNPRRNAGGPKAAILIVDSEGEDIVRRNRAPQNKNK